MALKKSWSPIVQKLAKKIFLQDRQEVNATRWEDQEIYIVYAIILIFFGNKNQVEKFNLKKKRTFLWIRFKLNIKHIKAIIYFLFIFFHTYFS